MENLSRILKSRRKELGLTLAQIADKIGVTEATVQRWESGNIKSVRYEKINALSDVLMVSPAVLMGWENDEDIKLGLDLQLSNKSVSVLRLLPRTIDTRTGLTLMDVLNALLENDKTQNIIKDLLFYYVRTDSDWAELAEKMNAEAPSSFNLSISITKKMSKYLITKAFEELVDDLSATGIKPYNKIETTKKGIRISARDETTMLRSLIDEE